MDHQKRLKRLRGEVAPAGLDGLLITHLPNIRYLCGFTGSAGALLITEFGGFFFTDGRYTAQARDEVRGATIAIAQKSPLVAAGEWLLSHRKKLGRGVLKFGIEGQHFTFDAHQRLAKMLGAGFRLRSAPPLVERARLIKDAEEIKLIRSAVNLGSSLFPHVLKAIRPGVKETEVAAKLEYAARKSGAEGMSFSTIIASGKRSALPHGQASASPISTAGFVVCDFGVILTGYCSDMTRTVFVGKSTPKVRDSYEAVREAQQAALDVIYPGKMVSEVDAAARKMLQRNKLSRYFTHSTGHGVGLEIHEAPRIAAGQDEILQPGMVITVEPGVYIPGKWGVRIEDMVLVTKRGSEVLTPTRKELIAID